MKAYFLIVLFFIISFFVPIWGNGAANASNSYTSPGYYTMDVSDIGVIEVILEGAGGGGAGNDPGFMQSGVQMDGGDGGMIEGRIDVSDFSQLQIYVGQGGQRGMQGTDGYGSGGWGRADGGDGSATISGASDAGGGGGSTEILGDGQFLIGADAGGGGSAYFDSRAGSNWRHGGGGGGSGGEGGNATSGHQDYGEDAESSDRGGNWHTGGDGGDCCPDNTAYHGSPGGGSRDSSYVDLISYQTGGGGSGGEGRESSSGGEDGEDGSISISVVPAEFEVGSLSTNKSEYMFGEEIEVSARIRNVGGEPDTQTVETKLGDFDYQYENTGDRVSSAEFPRCDCDNDPDEETCPYTHSATDNDPDYCYDHYTPLWFTYSRIHEKKPIFNDIASSSKSVYLGGQDYKLISTTITAPEEEGNQLIQVETDDDAREVSINVYEPEPANFELEKRDDSTFWDPDGVEEEEDSSVRMTVENTGDLSDCQNVTYEIPGVGTDSEEVCLEGGESDYWGPVLSVMPSYGDAGSYTGVVSSEDDSFQINVEILARPEILDTNVQDLTGCGDYNPNVALEWEYSDRNNPTADQDEFEIVIDDIDNDLQYSKNVSGPADTFYVDDHFNLNFESYHQWQIRVKNEEDLWSDWEDGEPFRTQARYPNVDFQYAPASPLSEEVVHFQDKSEVFSGSLETVNRRAWDLGSEANPERYKVGSGDQFIEVSASYPESGVREVILELTDERGKTCSVSKDLSIDFELPDWKEVAPF